MDLADLRGFVNLHCQKVGLNHKLSHHRRTILPDCNTLNKPELGMGFLFLRWMSLIFSKIFLFLRRFQDSLTMPNILQKLSCVYAHIDDFSKDKSLKGRALGRCKVLDTKHAIDALYLCTFRFIDQLIDQT